MILKLEVGDVVRLRSTRRMRASARGLIVRVAEIYSDNSWKGEIIENPNKWPHPDVVVRNFDDELIELLPPFKVPKFTNVGDAIVWMETVAPRIGDWR